MNAIKHASILSVAVSLLSLPLGAAVQWEKKPHTEWSDKEVQKVLNDSPWARTQVFTNPTPLFNQGVTGRQGAGVPPPPQPAAATHVNFRIRFFSAKPIRQAIGRMMELQQKQPISEELAAHLKSLASGEFLELIVITVSVDSKEVGANVQQAASLLRTRGTGELKNSTFIETRGGHRVFLQEYQPPRADGLGARFIFPRLVDGEPFITPDSQEIHFVTELSSDYRLNMRYKIKEMMYEGKLEY